MNYSYRDRDYEQRLLDEYDSLPEQNILGLLEKREVRYVVSKANYPRLKKLYSAGQYTL